MFSYDRDSSVLPEKGTEFLKITFEVDAYINASFENVDLNVEIFWLYNKDKYPHLFKLAKKILTIPATSAPVERLFSKAGYIHRKNRMKLTKLNLERSVLLKANVELMKPE